MSKRSGCYPCPVVGTAGSMVVSQAGGVLLTETVRAVGLDRGLSTALARWRGPNAVHDPARVLLDLATCALTTRLAMKRSAVGVGLLLNEVQ